MNGRKIVITGTAGLLGPYVARHFVEQGYEVTGVDRVSPKEKTAQENLLADLTNLGEVYSALAGAAEKVAEGIHRRNHMQIVSFRLGNVITEPMYENFKGWINDPRKRVLNVWNYIDARDIATACRLAIEKDGLGCEIMNLAADDRETVTGRFRLWFITGRCSNSNLRTARIDNYLQL